MCVSYFLVLLLNSFFLLVSLSSYYLVFCAIDYYLVLSSFLLASYNPTSLNDVFIHYEKHTLSYLLIVHLRRLQLLPGLHFISTNSFLSLSSHSCPRFHLILLPLSHYSASHFPPVYLAQYCSCCHPNQPLLFHHHLLPISFPLCRFHTPSPCSTASMPNLLYAFLRH